MPTYNELKPENYYLVIEKTNEGVALVYVLMETEKAILIEYQNEIETHIWKKKTEEIAELVEKLSPQKATEYENLVLEDDDDDFDFSDLDDDDDEEDDFLFDDDSEKSNLKVVK